ncbi:hypothetical protein SAMN04488128_103115 [Chitinophaga eiseniae]|uniref:DoxX protein n=1 Tax=Chitinophaga eiseniae TaxID=634771 RepID=A0A1T4SMN2_9BACT|nr:DUF6041 domain-containing protein [Chitinophaga eiseniae]SKA29413.1 hypothetical protein SAMN04488128_103115 [Chitinophaga eiseniae]
MKNTILFIQRTLGILFLLAGIDKFTKLSEDPFDRIKTGFNANTGSYLEPVSTFIFNHHTFFISFVGVLMITTGLVEIINNHWVKPAGILQIIMLASFMLYFHRAIPQIFIIDGVFIVLLIIVVFQGGK